MNPNPKNLDEQPRLDHPPQNEVESAEGQPLAFAFWGTPSRFSRSVLQQLLSARLEPDAIFCASSKPRAMTRHPGLLAQLRPLSNPIQTDELDLSLATTWTDPNIINLGWDADIPVFEVEDLRDAALARQLLHLKLDVACVACFPWKIPPEILAIPHYGFLNVHPSLLPAYRGPAPLFWILKEHAWETAAGVTIHWMDKEWDTGDVAVQRSVELAPGIDLDDANRICAEVGGKSLVEVLHNISRGCISRFPQRSGGSYRGWPKDADHW